MLQTKNSVLFVLFIALMAIGCSNDNPPPAAPLASFSPEIVNNTDAFSFQITDGENISTTVEYTWQNTGTQATIDHSTTTTTGSATLTVFADDSSQVYNSGLVASANEPSSAGTAGSWRVRVVFVNYSGTSNFRLEKL